MNAHIRLLRILSLGTVLFCFWVPHAHGQAGVPLWTNIYTSSNLYSPTRMAVDQSGNTVVTGSSYIGGFDPSTSEYLTVAYSSSGKILWVNRYDGGIGHPDNAAGVALDGEGSVYVTGDSYLTSYDYATIKYSVAGIPLWTNRFGNSSYIEKAKEIATDRYGNVWVTGRDDTYGALVTLKYSPSGSLGPGGLNYLEGYPEAMATDIEGNVFVTGFAPTGFGSQYSTYKYSTNGGTPLWNKRYGIVGTGQANAVTIDQGGNAFVTGYSAGNIVTVKYSSAGTQLWASFYPSGQAMAAATDTNGSVMVTGHSIGPNGIIEDFVTLKYSSSGVPLWTNRYNSPNNGSDRAVAVVVDVGGRVYVTGGGSPSSAITIAYSSFGVPIWTNSYPGNPAGLGLDRDGNVYVAGACLGSKQGYFVVKYSSFDPSPVPLEIRGDGESHVLSWPDARFHLQASEFAASGFTNVPGAISPVTITNLGGAQQFFRLVTE